MTARALRHWWSRTIAVILGVVLLTGCSSFDGAYDLPLPGHEVDADEAFEVTAYFRDVLNVVPRSPIMVDDVVVGEVGEVERAGWNARITLLIREDIKLPDNVIADIRQVSLLGEKYVALESLNNLTATLNAEKDVIGEALDATGPAIKVLADQEDELVEMLTALDKLGKVGTRVINASKEDVLTILKDLSPILRKLREADEQLAPGLNLLVSFPFPQSANKIVQGDYADTIAQVDIDLANLYKTLGIPEIQLPDLVEVLDQVGRCLKSGKLTGAACAKVLNDINLLKDLKAQCKTAVLKNSPVCKLLNALPDLDLGKLLQGGLLGADGALSGLTRGLIEPGGSYGAQSTDELLGATA